MGAGVVCGRCDGRNDTNAREGKKTGVRKSPEQTMGSVSLEKMTKASFFFFFSSFSLAGSFAGPPGSAESSLVAVAEGRGRRKSRAGGPQRANQKDSGGAHRRGKRTETVIAAVIRASGRA